MIPQDYAICIVVFVIAMWIYLFVEACVKRHEALKEVVREVNMRDEYRIMDPYKGCTCILSHKMCKGMDCRKCVFAMVAFEAKIKRREEVDE